MDALLDPVTAAFVAKLPVTREEGRAAEFDGRALLADYLAATAIAKAQEVYLALGGFMADGDRTLEDLAAYIEARGMAFLEAWADLMLRTGQDREDWAREAANRAALAYRDRLGELMENAGQGGQS